MKPIVYFSRTITPEKVLELYQKLGKTLTGNLAIKVHSGEPGNQNFLRPDFWKPLVDHVGGTIVETNAAFHFTEDHPDNGTVYTLPGDDSVIYVYCHRYWAQGDYPAWLACPLWE